MDPLLAGLFKQFTIDNALETMKSSDAFELFVTTLLLPDDLLDQRELTDFLLDESTIGIDVATLEINGQLINGQSDIDDACANRNNLEVTLTLLQVKSSPGMDSTEILNFGDTILKVLSNQVPSTHPKLKSVASSFFSIFDNHASKLKTKPTIRCIFASTAGNAALTDTNVVNRTKTIKQNIEAISYIGDVTFDLYGAARLYDASLVKNHANETDVVLDKSVNLPEMPGIDQAILGVMSLSELLKLIKHEDQTLNERVFYQNVRGFKGIQNTVNEQIMDTLASSERSLLPVLNNGVTVVAREYSPKPGDAVRLSGYQVVNGCQTSHCIYESEDDLDGHLDSTFIPFRIVVTSDERVATSIIRATNSQTAVDKSDLVALTKFQRKLEDFYQQDVHKVGLTYERRSGQFYYRDVTRTRIVTITEQMRSFAAMFLDNPHAAARYPKALYDDIGKIIFDEDHRLSPYVASAFAAYRLEAAFRSSLETSFKPLRYHILMACKYVILGGRANQLNSAGIDKQSQRIINELSKPDYVTTFREIAYLILGSLNGVVPSPDRLKRQALTNEIITDLMRSSQS